MTTGCFCRGFFLKFCNQGRGKRGWVRGEELLLQFPGNFRNFRQFLQFWANSAFFLQFFFAILRNFSSLGASCPTILHAAHACTDKSISPLLCFHGSTASWCIFLGLFNKSIPKYSFGNLLYPKMPPPSNFKYRLTQNFLLRGTEYQSGTEY